MDLRVTFVFYGEVGRRCKSWTVDSYLLRRCVWPGGPPPWSGPGRRGVTRCPPRDRAIREKEFTDANSPVPPDLMGAPPTWPPPRGRRRAGWADTALVTRAVQRVVGRSRPPGLGGGTPASSLPRTLKTQSVNVFVDYNAFSLHINAYLEPYIYNIVSICHLLVYYSSLV